MKDRRPVPPENEKPSAGAGEKNRVGRPRCTVYFPSSGSLILLCHKSNFALGRPQHGHCPSRAIS